MSNSTTNQNNKQKTNQYTDKTPFVPEADLMSIDEIKTFLKSLLFDAQFHPYSLDGFIFLFKTVDETANQSTHKLRDLCEELKSFIYVESSHCHNVCDKYAETIHNRYRQTDYTSQEREIYQEIEKEVECLKKFESTEQPQPAKQKPELNERQKKTLEETSHQLEMAMMSDKTPQGVKDCLYTIIFEASNEAGMPLGDISLIRPAFVNIIENLSGDYRRGILSSVQEILRFNTTAFDDYHEQQKPESKVLDLSESSVEDLARKLSDIIHNPYTSDRIRGCIEDELLMQKVDFYTPENILIDLKTKLESEND
jgi:hypothetical protein